MLVDLDMVLSSAELGSIDPWLILDEASIGTSIRPHRSIVDLYNTWKREQSDLTALASASSQKGPKSVLPLPLFHHWLENSKGRGPQRK